MNTIIGLDKSNFTPTPGADIPNGQAFIGRVGNSNEELFLKTYGGVIGLRDPGLLFYANFTSIVAYRPVDLKIEVL